MSIKRKIAKKVLKFSKFFWLVILHVLPTRSASGSATKNFKKFNENLTPSVDSLDVFQTQAQVFSKFVVSIRIHRPKKLLGDNHHCTGIAVSPKVVLTAAHCGVEPIAPTRFSLSPRDVAVVAGSRILSELTSNTRVYRVTHIYTHPFYDPASHDADIALFYLEKAMGLASDFENQMRLSDRIIPPGTMCILFGWGEASNNGVSTGKLFYMKTEVIECSNIKRKLMCTTNRLNLLKAKTKADSGGPLVCNGELAGILSHGVLHDTWKSNNSVVPQVIYSTNVRLYHKWIESGVANVAIKFNLSMFCEFLVCFLILNTLNA